MENEKTSAVIIRNGEIICSVNTSLKNGADVEYGYHKIKEAINASIDHRVINTKDGKISRSKKYLESDQYLQSDDFGLEINKGEFFIS
jgi:hypothetical protein